MFQRYLATILKTSVRFTLKELTCEFSSVFDIISGSEEGGILFLQIAVMFGMTKKKRRMIAKENIVYRIFSQTRRKTNIQHFNKK